jgi:hypothetical protein
MTITGQSRPPRRRGRQQRSTHGREYSCLRRYLKPLPRRISDLNPLKNAWSSAEISCRKKASPRAVNSCRITSGAGLWKGTFQGGGADVFAYQLMNDGNSCILGVPPAERSAAKVITSACSSIQPHYTLQPNTPISTSMQPSS